MSDKKGFWSIFGNASDKETSVKQETQTLQKSDSSSEELELNQEVCDYAVEKLQELLKAGGLLGNVSLKHFTPNFFALDINDAGDDNGRLIGKQGTTVLALQTLVRQFVFRKFGVRCKLSIDVDGYKDRQNSQLKAEVMEIAKRVIKDGGEVALAPMSAIERRQVHVMFEHHEVLMTESRGEDQDRYVVIKHRDY